MSWEYREFQKRPAVLEHESLAWGVLQESQKKPGSRQAEKELFG